MSLIGQPHYNKAVPLVTLFMTFTVFNLSYHDQIQNCSGSCWVWGRIQWLAFVLCVLLVVSIVQ